MTRYRVTIRGEGVELRGYVDRDLPDLARAMTPHGLVVASPAADDYNPFRPPVLEIVHSRDPDSACSLTVFVDGAEVEDYTLEDIDPGSGWERSEWNERYDLPESYSPAFIAATLEALDAAGGSEYIEGGDDE